MLTKEDFNHYEQDKEKFLYILNHKIGKNTLDQIVEKVEYEKELVQLQAELVNLQRWVAKHKKRVCIIFEGRDAAGKGGSIRRFTEHLNPRSMRVVALTKPTEVEKG